jgi:hypothetical protein
MPPFVCNLMSKSIFLSISMLKWRTLLNGILIHFAHGLSNKKTSIVIRELHSFKIISVCPTFKPPVWQFNYPCWKPHFRSIKNKSNVNKCTKNIIYRASATPAVGSTSASLSEFTCFNLSAWNGNSNWNI